MIRAVLFDMDGLLTDSERVYARGIQAVMDGLGISISDDAIAQALGTTDPVTDQIFSRGNPRYDGDAMRSAVNDWLVRNGYDRAMPLKPGAEHILRTLTGRGVLCALVTSSPLSRADNYLGGQGLLSLFSAVITGDLGLPSKPAPDVYLTAAARLGVPIADCAVLEDSYNGLRAGRAAGAMTVMVPDLAPYCEEIAPFVDHLAADLSEAEGILCP